MTTIDRRRLLQFAGTTLAGSLVAGCLGDEPGAGDGDDGDDGNDGNDGDDGDDGNDGGDGGDGDDGNDGDDGDDGDDLPDGIDSRTDEPPHEIDVPECGEGDGRDPLYLCANVESEPSLGFQQETTTGELFVDEGLTLDDEPQGDSEFYVALLTDEDDRDRVVDEGTDVTDLVHETDFDESAVLIVQTGWGSGSIVPHLKRIEETDDGIHAHGCQSDPCAGTADFTHRSAVVRFDRPDALDEAIVSLTLDPETRVHLAASEGIVTLEDE